MNVNSIGSVTDNTSQTATTVKSTGTASFSSVLSKAKSTTTDLESIFNKASEKYGVPVSLIKAVAKTESNFNASATSSCGAMGIMQLMPGTAKSLGVDNAYDAEQNIMGGAKYLSQMLKQFDGNVQLSLAAYNAGPGNVSKYGGIPPFKETQAYVERVMGYYSDYSNDAGAASTVSVGSNSGSEALISSLSEISKDASSAEILSTIMSLSTQMLLYDKMGSGTDKSSGGLFSSSDSLQLLQLAMQLNQTKEDGEEKT